VALDKGQLPYDLDIELEARPKVARGLSEDVCSVLSRSWSIDPLARPKIDELLLAMLAVGAEDTVPR
jgi:hypothetical protein